MRKRVGRQVTEEELTKEEALRLWKEARPVKVERRRSGSSVLSVRLPDRVFDELVLEARRQGKGPATLARELIEEGLARREEAPLPLFFERLAQRLRELQRQAPSVRFSETPRGWTTQLGWGMLGQPIPWASFRPARTAALLAQPSTKPAEERTKVEVRVM